MKGVSLRAGLSPSVEPVPVSPPDGASIPDAWGPIEYEEGYPVDEDFTALSNTKMDFWHAARWLLSELPRAQENMCCWCEVVEGTEGAKPGKTILFATYGWSGAESIMSLIERRFDMKHFMLTWRRGGHYTFEIPERFLPQRMNND